MRRAAIVLAVCLVPVAAAAQEGPPPTPAPPSGVPSPFPQELRTPPPGRSVPPIAAPSAVLIELETGRILHAQRARERRPVASTTKVMTALVVLERARPGEIVEVGPSAASQSGAVLGLRTGERISVRRLLYALLLGSANDAAVALAEHVSGSVGAFVEEMNRRARALGAGATRFTSPNGLDDRGVSTATDLASITAAAFAHPLFRTIVSTRVRSIPGESGERVTQNRNALLWLYPGATGVKTGFTNAAGYCLVAAAERDGLELVTVVLGGETEVFSDSAALLDHGFASYERRVVVEDGEVFEPGANGLSEPAVAGATVEALVPRGASLVYRVSEAAPAADPDVIGTLTVSAGGETVVEAPLLAAPEDERPIVPSDVLERARRSIASSIADLFAAIF